MSDTPKSLPGHLPSGTILPIPRDAVIDDVEHARICLLPEVEDDSRFLTDFGFPAHTTAIISCRPDAERTYHYVILCIKFFSKGVQRGEIEVGGFQTDVLPLLALDPGWPTVPKQLMRAYAVAVATLASITLAEAECEEICARVVFPGFSTGCRFTLAQAGYGQSPTTASKGNSRKKSPVKKVRKKRK